MHFRIKDIASVVATAEEGSFLRASRKLHCSRGAITNSVDRIESAFRTKLFDRKKGRLEEGGITVTENGHDIIRKLRTMVQLYEEIRNA